MVKPIKSAVVFAEEIASGNLRVTVDCSSNDEMGQLCKALTDMATRLSGIVNEIIEGADTASEAKKIKEQLASGEVKIVIGTHSLLQKDIKFHNLVLAIIEVVRLKMR